MAGYGVSSGGNAAICDAAAGAGSVTDGITGCETSSAVMVGSAGAVGSFGYAGTNLALDWISFAGDQDLRRAEIERHTRLPGYQNSAAGFLFGIDDTHFRQHFVRTGNRLVTGGVAACSMAGGSIKAVCSVARSPLMTPETSG